MAGERPAQRDLQHTLRLLWRTQEPPRRGPRGSLSLDKVVAEAVRLADEEGIGAVSMRRVAEGLGVTTMSLYRYVPGKDDLLDLMLEMVTGRPDTSAWPGTWRGDLECWARQMRHRLHEHPWMLDVHISGPPLGPDNLAWMEAALGSLAEAGLDARGAVGVLMILSGYVRSQALLELSLARAAHRTGVRPEEWGRVYTGMLRNAADDGRYPHLMRAVESGAFTDGDEDADADFEYGLCVTLDGIAARVPPAAG